MRCEVLTVVSTRIIVFWCHRIYILRKYEHFGGTCCQNTRDSYPRTPCLKGIQLLKQYPIVMELSDSI